MPRRMPRLDRELSRRAQAALSIVRAGELARAYGPERVRTEWSVSRLESLYELAYLRAFSAWEICLEAIFYRSLCGFASGAGQETLVVGGYYPSVAAAEAAVMGNRDYLLWHNPRRVIDRCRRYIRSGAPGCPAVQEMVISSNLADLNDYASVRHRIVHDQADAKRQFDAATLRLAGRTYRASRPGKFLRDWDPPRSGSAPRRRLETMVSDLVGLTSQLV